MLFSPDCLVACGQVISSSTLTSFVRVPGPHLIASVYAYGPSFPLLSSSFFNFFPLLLFPFHFGHLASARLKKNQFSSARLPVFKFTQVKKAAATFKPGQLLTNWLTDCQDCRFFILHLVYAKKKIYISKLAVSVYLCFSRLRFFALAVCIP